MWHQVIYRNCMLMAASVKVAGTVSKSFKEWVQKQVLKKKPILFSLNVTTHPEKLMLKRMSEYYYTTVYTVKCDMTSLHSTPPLSLTHTYSHILSLFLSHSLSLRHFYPPALATVCLFGNQSSFLNRSTAVPGTDGVKERVRNFRGWVRGLKGKHTEERRRQGERERE